MPAPLKNSFPSGQACLHGWLSTKGQIFILLSVLSLCILGLEEFLKSHFMEKGHKIFHSFFLYSGPSCSGTSLIFYISSSLLLNLESFAGFHTHTTSSCFSAFAHILISSLHVLPTVLYPSHNPIVIIFYPRITTLLPPKVGVRISFLPFFLISSSLD